MSQLLITEKRSASSAPNPEGNQSRLHATNVGSHQPSYAISEITAQENGKTTMEGNLKKAAAYCHAAAESGAVPIAPHLYFSAYLDDRIPEERTAGMQMGLHILRRCDELWVFGTPTEGMKEEIKLAKSLHIPILYISEEIINRILERGQTA